LGAEISTTSAAIEPKDSTRARPRNTPAGNGGQLARGES
jgi:hypothetical protein